MSFICGTWEIGFKIIQQLQGIYIMSDLVST